VRERVARVDVLLSFSMRIHPQNTQIDDVPLYPCSADATRTKNTSAPSIQNRTTAYNTHTKIPPNIVTELAFAAGDPTNARLNWISSTAATSFWRNHSATSLSVAFCTGDTPVCDASTSADSWPKRARSEARREALAATWESGRKAAEVSWLVKNPAWVVSLVSAREGWVSMTRWMMGAGTY
jgi:hypothetical protein